MHPSRVPSPAAPDTGEQADPEPGPWQPLRTVSPSPERCETVEST